MTYDVFISHADEDSTFAILLADKLKALDLEVFLDKYELKAGDSLSSTINRAVLNSRFAVVIASPIYFEKKWTMREVGAFLAREDAGKMGILPLLHELDYDELKNLFPILVDKLALSSSDGLDHIALAISEVVDSNTLVAAPNTATDASANESIKRSSADRSLILELWRSLRRFATSWQGHFVYLHPSSLET